MVMRAPRAPSAQVGLSLLGELLVARAADEGAEQDGVRRGAVGELGGGPGAGGDAAAFAVGDDEAEALERVLDFAALVAERDGGGGDVADLLQQVGELGGDAVQQVGGDVGGRAADDLVCDDVVAAAEGDVELALLARTVRIWRLSRMEAGSSCAMSASTSCCRPPWSVMNMESGWAPGADAGRGAFLRLSMPRSRLPCLRSISRNMGKVLCRLRCAGSAA